MKLKGKVAVVTGATKGIGLACAKEYIKEGAKVVLTGRSRDLGEAAVENITRDGGEALFVPCDVANSTQVNALIERTVEHFGKIDIMLSNAGTNGKAEFLDVTEEDWDRIIDTNLKGIFLCGQAAARQMVKQGHGGYIINMSSVMAVLGLKNQVAYSASKGGINQLTKVMALGLIDYGIRVNAIGPGPIMTELMQRVADDETVMNAILRRTPEGRIGTGEEVGRLAVFLSCEDCGFIMGQTIYQDGGRIIQSFDRENV
ncbi:MAG: SDR family oxidoreductase [Desulfobacteraceae bacterium]|nr:MAG: SDR family oxidoreductase [Desulfobacteraceae bacterium]